MKREPEHKCEILHLLRTAESSYIMDSGRMWERGFTLAGDIVNAKHDLPTFFDPSIRAKDYETMEFTDVRPPYRHQWIETVSEFAGCHFGYLVSHFPKNEEKDRPERVQIFAYVKTKNQDRPICRAAALMDLNENGDAATIKPLPPGPDNKHIGDRLSEQTQVDYIWPVIKVLQVMNAINVGFYQVRDPDETNMSLCRKRRRAAFSRRYHILTLRTPADIRAGRKEVQNPGSMPLNTARGHWSHYGPKYGRKLLFGKYEGRFWIPAHARGKASNGVVEKGYELPAKPIARDFPRTPSETRDASRVFDPSNLDIQSPQEATHE